MATPITIQKLKSILKKDVDTARAQILHESGEIIADRIADTSKGKVIPEVKENRNSVWTGVDDAKSYTTAMYEETYGTRPFANTMNWLRTREPFVRLLRSKLPWVK